MLKESEKWIAPENLIEQERKETQEVERGDFDGKGDFGSYYALLTNKNSDWVKPHAIMSDGFAVSYAKQVKNILAGLRLNLVNLAVLDVGCGPGTITNAFANVFENSSVTGVDISVHSIKYAQQKYPKCTFIQKAVEGCTILPQKYNVIHAREFYPFTRTSDIEFHLAYLKMFSSHLKNRGVIVLSFAPLCDSFENVWSKVSLGISMMGLAPIKKIPLASARFVNILPGAVSSRLTPIVYRCLRKTPAHFYVTQKNDETIDG